MGTGLSGTFLQKETGQISPLGHGDLSDFFLHSREREANEVADRLQRSDPQHT